MRTDEGAGCDLSITLVHGTWPRSVWRDVFLSPFYGRWPGGFFPKNLWFADGSEFVNSLTAALSKGGLSAQISPFLWSGANSIQERDRAAHQLVEHLNTKESEYPGSTHVIIAHSHGGNVALRALDKAELNQNVLVATIATPFVEILPAKLSRKQSLLIALSLALAINSFVKLLPEMSIAVNSVFYLIVNALIFLLYFRSNPKVQNLVRLTSLSSSVRKHPLLILRAVDDEASLSLAAAAIGNRISTLIGNWSFVIVMVLLGLVILSLLSILFLSASATLVGVGSFEDNFEAWVDWWFVHFPLRGLFGGTYASIGAFVCFVAFLVAPGVFKSAYGRELLFNSQGCQINSQSAPDSIDRHSEFRSDSERSSWGMMVTLHQTEEARRGLRHGLYGDPQCAERIAEWLQLELASQTDQSTRT